MTPNQQLEALKRNLAAKLEARKAATAAIEAVRSNTAATDAEATVAVEARRAIDAEIDVLQVRSAELAAEVARDEAMERLQAEIVPVTTGRSGTLPGSGGNVRVTGEPLTYRRDNDPNGRSFVRDVGLAFLHGSRARESNERLDRHTDEMRVEKAEYMDRVATTTSAFAGLVVPQYLTEMYAPKARAMRPFADACNHHDLPESGMVINLSTITTGTSAALQASENAAVSETNIDDTLLAIAVQTNAAAQSMSRQAIERGTGTEEVTLQDMYRAYATTLDNTLINQATTGLAASATTVTYTDASPTGPETYGQIIAAMAGVEAIMLNMASGDNITVMHSRRWYSLQSSMSATFPMINQGLGQNIGVNYQEKYGAGVRGVLPNGTPVIVDNNIVTNLGGGTNQDEIYVADQQECHLWEDSAAPIMIRAEQTQAKNLDIDFVLYGFFAYTFSRYAGQNQKVTGTGLIPPTFTGA
jgi:hypothetical protein